MAKTAPDSTTGADKKEKKVIETLFSERDLYQQANQEQRTEINEIYQAYAGELNDPKDRSKSQEKIMKLRTETNYIVPSIFSGNPELEVEAIGEEDKDLAEVCEEIVNYRLETIPQAYEKIEAWVKQAVVFGTSIINIVWKFETKKVKEGDTEYETPIKDEPDLQVHNILDCFYNPIIADVESQNSLIFRSVQSLYDVKRNESYNKNKEKVNPKGMTSENTWDSSKQVQTDRFDMSKVSKDTVEIYERVTCDRIQTVADGKERLLLRDEPNPDDIITAVKLVHEPNAIPNRFDGYGVGHNTLGIGRLIQKMKNRTIDNVALTNNPFFIAQKGVTVDKRQLVVKVGGMLEVDAGAKSLSDVIQTIQFPDIKQGAVALMNQLEDDHKRASGANDLLQGAASNATLGQDQIASTYSSNRFELINRRFKQALADVGKILIMKEIQNIQSIDAPILKIFPLEAEVVNGKIRYSRETVYEMLVSARERGDIKLNIRIKGETNIARNKDMLLKQFSEWYTQFGPILPPANQLAAAKKWLELRGIDEVDKLVPDPEDLPQPEEQLGAPGSPEMPVNVPQQPQLQL